ncbi:uncharacterized protein Z519_02230 [Cladophialophora bantiana CBS 173.52]|uniref:75k gamma secalin n=1 Tax=Cladophialophora bantiana (strain ATCC 10958 / CBS 173.52 / CDC B-1940 / NIH 8579) TaxID=1442370 RepID=A0A0D2IJ81_CLAB1|nr:uncharacterized protein Z519_02230 [Cladophialophora bantiana CBS 173.52]KIW96839.1 hypothetical protein Z519_02230 [Cladophialophora bantiana CBS 173.52]
MDPNFPYYTNNTHTNFDLNPGFFYGPNANTFPQPPSQQPPHPQAQSHYRSSHPQPVLRNNPQYSHNREYDQRYQPQLQQFQKPFYQQPAQFQPQQLAHPGPDTILVSPSGHPIQSSAVQPHRGQQPSQIVPDTVQVSNPHRSVHSSSPHPRQGQQTPRVSHQPKSQVRKQSPTYQNTPNHYQLSQHEPQPPQQYLGQQSQSPDLPKSASTTASSPKKKERHEATGSTPITPNMPRQNKPRVLQAVEINATRKQRATKAPNLPDSPAEPDEPEPEYHSLLCVLADDYLEAARKQPAPTEVYYTLIATALGCLESVLSNFKLPPLREAQVSLRYAEVLYAETENYDDAEMVLAKAIELCERHKFIDLKYEMQLLLSKVLYESKPKAALRDIQRIIEDIEAYRHTVWLYIFRFQHAMFSLASSAPGEMHSAIVQLEKITNLAHQNSDSAILAFAATLEALLHLASSSHEAVTASQMALAKARALQLSPDVEAVPQLTILMEYVDLACSVRAADIAQTERKRKIVHEVLYQAVSHPNWREDGLIYVPVAARAVADMQLHGNRHVIERNGKYYLPFSWLGKETTEALGFLLSAESSAYKNGADGGKAQKFVESGVALVRALGNPSLRTGYRQSRREFICQRLLEAEFLLLLIPMQCSKGLWEAANSSLAKVHAISEDIGDAFPVNMKHSLLYLRGVILQGTGDLKGALQVYQSPLLSFDSQHAPTSTRPEASNKILNSYYADSDITRNFSILAAINSALIIHNPTHPQHSRLSSLTKSLESAIRNCGNRYIKAHFSLLESILSTNRLAEKQFLKRSMDESKVIGSALTTALALIYMQDQLYKGVVDEQAMKCARAASIQTKKWGQPMWMHVAAGLEAQALEIHGFVNEAQQKKAEAEAGWEKLPNGVKGI